MGIPVKGYENYIVYKDGKVFSLYTNKFLKPSPVGCGYLTVELFKDHKSKRKSVHRLVAEAFVPNPLNLPQVNHKDENKANNHYLNLEWVTAKENMNYGTGNERRKCSRAWYVNTERIKAQARINGKKRAKKVAQFTKDNKFLACYDSIKQAAIALNINHSGICACCKGIRKSVGGYIWKYKGGLT